MLILITIVLAITALSQTEFDQPWKDKTRAIVIDAYEENGIDWDKLAGDGRVVAVIHRATVGLRTDGMYAARRARAKQWGYKWGSYHMGKAGDPIRQADHYLAFTKPGDDEVIALDVESLDNRADMSLANAIQFIDRIKERTGRYPLLYGNQTVVQEISRVYKRENVFAELPLWYARFKSSVTDFPRSTWSTYTLWQFSSEMNCTQALREHCLYLIPGTETDMDINVFNGTVEELRSRWPMMN